jgi:hypothetical protein
MMVGGHFSVEAEYLRAASDQSCAISKLREASVKQRLYSLTKEHAGE